MTLVQSKYVGFIAISHAGQAIFKNYIKVFLSLCLNSLLFLGRKLRRSQTVWRSGGLRVPRPLPELNPEECPHDTMGFKELSPGGIYVQD